MLIEETPVADAALPVSAFRAHVRLGSGFAEDSLQDDVLVGFLRAALAAIEGRTGKALFERAFVWSVSRWRRADRQILPVAPVRALTRLETVSRSGTRAQVANDAFWLEQDPGQPAMRAVGHSLPAIPEGGKAELQLVAGYGATWEEIPVDLRQAVLLLAAHYYEFRHETALGEGCMPFGVSSLIERYKLMRLYAGGAR